MPHSILLPIDIKAKICTVCPGSSDPFYIVSYYINWVTSSWTYSRTFCHTLLKLPKI